MKETGRMAVVVAVKALQRQREWGQQMERHLKILHPKIFVGGQSIWLIRDAIVRLPPTATSEKGQPVRRLQVNNGFGVYSCPN